MAARDTRESASVGQGANGSGARPNLFNGGSEDSIKLRAVALPPLTKGGSADVIAPVLPPLSSSPLGNPKPLSGELTPKTASTEVEPQGSESTGIDKDSTGQVDGEDLKEGKDVSLLNSCQLDGVVTIEAAVEKEVVHVEKPPANASEVSLTASVAKQWLWLAYASVLALIPLKRIGDVEDQRLSLHVWIYCILMSAFCLPVSRVYTNIVKGECNEEAPAWLSSVVFLPSYFLANAVVTMFQLWPIPISMVSGCCVHLPAVVSTDLYWNRQAGIKSFFKRRLYVLIAEVIISLAFFLGVTYFMLMVAYADTENFPFLLTMAYGLVTAGFKMVCHQLRGRAASAMTHTIGMCELLLEFFTLFASPKVESTVVLAFILLPELVSFLWSFAIAHMAFNRLKAVYTPEEMKLLLDDDPMAAEVLSPKKRVDGSKLAAKAHLSILHILTEVQANVWPPLYYLVLGSCMRYGPAKYNYPLWTFNDEDYLSSVFLALASIAFSILMFIYVFVHFRGFFGFNVMRHLAGYSATLSLSMEFPSVVGAFAGILFHEYTAMFSVFFGCHSIMPERCS